MTIFKLFNKSKPLKRNIFIRSWKKVREYYLFCGIVIAEHAAKKEADRHMEYANYLKTFGKGHRWEAFKTRWTGRKFYFQAAICRYARRSGTYKNL